MIKRYPNDNNQTIGIKLPANGQKGRAFFNTSQTTEEQAISNYINLLFHLIDQILPLLELHTQIL